MSNSNNRSSRPGLFGATSSSTDFPFPVGSKILFRGITMYYIGEVQGVNGRYLSLAPNSVWVVDLGDLTKALGQGVVPRCEKFPQGVQIPLDTMVDCTEWTHAVPSGNSR